MSLLEDYLAEGTIRLVTTCAEKPQSIAFGRKGALLADWRNGQLAHLVATLGVGEYTLLQSYQWDVCGGCGAAVAIHPLAYNWRRRYAILPGSVRRVCVNCIIKYPYYLARYREMLAGSPNLDMLGIDWSTQGYRLTRQTAYVHSHYYTSDSPRIVARELRALGVEDFIISCTMHDVMTTCFRVYVYGCDRDLSGIQGVI